MIKLETHCHTKGTSSCADADEDYLVREYVKAGYGAVTVTNHVSVACFPYYPGESKAEKIRFYFSCYERMREKFSAVGIKTFCAAEVRCVPENGRSVGTEYTVVGITEKMMADNPYLFTLTQRQLFSFAEKNGLFMYQTHPFRENVTVGDPRYMHGAEAFNGHYHQFNYNALAEDFCKRNGLIGLSGTDFHHEGQPITAGIYIPEDICTEAQLIEFLFKNSFDMIKDDVTYENYLRKNKAGIIK